jgi:hypothetical protein
MEAHKQEELAILSLFFSLPLCGRHHVIRRGMPYFELPGLERFDQVIRTWRVGDVNFETPPCKDALLDTYMYR